MKKEQSYLVVARIQDGEHQHYAYGTVNAENDTVALAHAEESAPTDSCGLDTEASVWTWGDGQTATEIMRVEKLTPAEAKVLRKFKVTVELGSALEMQREHKAKMKLVKA